MTKADVRNTNNATQIADISNFSETTSRTTVMRKQIIIRALDAEVYRRTRTSQRKSSWTGNGPKSFIERVTRTS